MIKIFFTFWFLVGLLVSSVFAINQEEFIKRLQETHPFFKGQNLNTSIQQKIQKSHLGATDWRLNLNASSSASTFRTNDSGDPQNRGLKATSQNNFTSSFKRNFFSTGGNLSLDYQFTDTKNDLKEGTSSSTKQGASISYNQPLLKNFKGVLDRTAYDLVGYNIKIAELQSLEAKESFLLQQLFLFLDWALFEAEYKITQNRLKLLKKELATTQRKYKASFSLKVDLISQQAAVSNLELALLSKKSELADVREQLAALFQDKNFLDSEIPEINIFSLDFSIEKNLNNYLKENSRVLRIIQYQKQQNQRQQKSYHNQKQIQLDLSLSASQLDEITDTTSGSSSNGGSSNYEIALQFSLPLGNNQAEGQLAESLLQLQQLNYNYDSEFRNLLANLRGLETRLKILEDTLALNTNQISLARLRTLEEMRRYKLGHGSSVLVLQAQDNEQNAEVGFAQIAVVYQKIVLQYMALLDKLLP